MKMLCFLRQKRIHPFQERNQLRFLGCAPGKRILPGGSRTARRPTVFLRLSMFFNDFSNISRLWRSRNEQDPEAWWALEPEPWPLNSRPWALCSDILAIDMTWVLPWAGLIWDDLTWLGLAFLHVFYFFQRKIQVVSGAAASVLFFFNGKFK